MRFLFTLSCLLSCLFAADYERSIVKVIKVGASYDYMHPWHPPGQTMAHGSGFLTESGYIITNAHVVENTLFLQVKLACFPRRFTARVVAIGHDCDLALLKVDDPLFARIAEPLTWSSSMPNPRDPVVICGFPMGGEHLAVTYGRVARYEVSTYVNQEQKLMACQLDGLASPGSSGGPVLSQETGNVIGVIHQITGHQHRISEMIPLNIVAHFLSGVSSGEHKGFYSAGFSWRSLESAPMRRYYGVSPEQTGVVVTNIDPGSPAEEHFKRGDVITHINGHRVYNDGTYEFQKGQYLNILHLIKSARDGSTLKIESLRAGEARSILIAVDYNAKSRPLIGPIEYGRPPTYYVHGGFVFQPLTPNFVEALNPSGQADYLYGRLYDYFRRMQEKEGDQEVVLLTQVLPGECNVGYHVLNIWVVETINGDRIYSMRDLIEAIENNTSDYLVIGNNYDEEIIVDRAECEKESSTILRNHQIPSDRSVDLDEAPKEPLS